MQTKLINQIEIYFQSQSSDKSHMSSNHSRFNGFADEIILSLSYLMFCTKKYEEVERIDLI